MPRSESGFKRMDASLFIKNRVFVRKILCSEPYQFRGKSRFAVKTFRRQDYPFPFPTDSSGVDKDFSSRKFRDSDPQLRRELPKYRMPDPLACDKYSVLIEVVKATFFSDVGKRVFGVCAVEQFVFAAESLVCDLKQFLKSGSRV